MCLRKNETAILRRAERSIVRAMCGVKLEDKRNTEELIDMFGLKKEVDKLTRANGMSWYGRVLRRPEENILMKAMLHEADGKRKQGRPMMKWREKFEGNMRRIDLRKKDVADWCNSRKNCGSSKMHQATSIYWGNLTGLKLNCCCCCFKDSRVVSNAVQIFTIDFPLCN